MAPTRAERAGDFTGHTRRLFEVVNDEVDSCARQRGDIHDRYLSLAARLRFHAREIDLVGYDRQRALADVRGARRSDRGGQRLAGIRYPEQPIGTRGLELRAPHAFALDGVVR